MMKKMSVVMAILLLLGAQGFAQDVAREGRAQTRHDELKELLALTPDQENKIKSVNERFLTSFQTVRKDTSLSRQEAHIQLKKLRTEKDGEMKAILTDEQYAKWVALRKQQGNRKHAGSKVNHIEQMKNDLALSEDQYVKLKSIDNAFKLRATEIRSSEASTRQSELKKIKTERNAAIKGIPTPAQYEKWQIGKQKHTRDFEG